MNSYLALAFGLLWLIFVAYAVIIHRRQCRLENELEELKKSASDRNTPASPTP